MLTILICPDKIHADGLIAELKHNNYDCVKYDDRRILVETDYSDGFCNITVKHCAYMDGYRDGNYILTNEHFECWNVRVK
jgi:hypothetical protein